MLRNKVQRSTMRKNISVLVKHFYQTVLAMLVICPLAVGTSYAQDELPARDGNFLLRACTAALKAIDGNGTDQLLDAGMCVGFVRGFHLGHKATVLENRSRGIKTAFLYCADGVTTTQMVRVLLKSLNDHPQVLHLSSDILMYRSFAAAFPCK